MPGKILRKTFIMAIVAALTLGSANGLASEDMAADSQWRDWSGKQAIQDGLDSDEIQTWIVRLHDAPVVRYTGGIPGLEATSPRVTGQERFSTSQPGVAEYRQYLRDRQQEVLAGIAQHTGQVFDPDRRWQVAANGFVIETDARTAKAIASMPEIRSIKREIVYEPLTFAGPQQIGAPAIWEGTATGVESKGEDMVVAIVDSGINPDHESFAEVTDDGYEHVNPLGDGVFIGACDPDHEQYEPGYNCNNKLIGAFYFNPSDNTAFDDNGHGTHVAGTAAGNEVTTPDGLEISG
ncbi:S8 family serine peptidase, partial [Gammaproteobacteria bacterium AB-CW1]|nr:S8 family serine peptidase [Gammaproteobacteria bacterium AB-CW1]